MKNNLTKHVLNIGKEFDENLVQMSPLRGQDMHNRPVLYDVEYDRIDEIKSHLLLSKLKTIELVKEELEVKKLELKHQDTCLAVGENGKINEHYCDCRYQEIVAYNNGIVQAITLLDTIIQEIKLQMK